METDSITRYYIYGLSSSSNIDLIRYVGYSTNISDRLREHLKDVNRKYVNTYKKNWIKKEIELGNKIILNVIDEVVDRSEAKFNEIRVIKLLKSLGAKLVNGTLGGDGVICTEEVRAKMSIARMGTLHTKESKKKMSNSKKGIPLSKKHIDKISLASKGKCYRSIWTKEQKEEMSKLKKGMPSSRKGIKVSEKERSRLANLRIGMAATNLWKPVIQYSIDNILIKEWESLSKAQKILNVKNICRCIKGDRKTAGGFKWRYKK